MVKKVEKVECALLETKIVTNDGNVTQKEFDDAYRIQKTQRRSK